MQDVKNEVTQLKQSIRHHRIAFYGIFVVLVIVCISVIILLKLTLSSTPQAATNSYVMPTFAPVASPRPPETRQDENVKGVSTSNQDLLQSIMQVLSNVLKNTL